ncbi:hypothetical protein [Crocinitomix algicola]|uniref:hypothetical protein n=1 Tax=Crocinitomix algicola TaxID=1740263 RepID=UPI0008343B5D|nr:hypothetical protein [Crocinitomix algicola]
MKWLTLYIASLPFLIWSQFNDMKQFYKLGDSTIEFYIHHSQVEQDFIFLNLHEDESTSIEALHHVIGLHDFSFFYLQHAKTRRINFSLEGKQFDIDPNRIFTKKGVKKTLKEGAGKSRKAVKEVQGLTNSILNFLPPGKTVIAVHNNTDVNYSIKSYLPEGDEAQNTAQIFINEEMDPDDFIYTTHLPFYEAFKKRKINVILQDNTGFVNDGSLSVYCGMNNVPYINIETQKGHFKEQVALINIVLEVLKEK